MQRSLVPRDDNRASAVKSFMMSSNPDISVERAHAYNERMFSKGLRGKLHSARFEWLVRQLKRRGIERASIFELGCHDARTIDFLEESGLTVDRYLGVDANEHGGIEMAKERFGGRPGFEFVAGAEPSAIPQPKEPFDLLICMETFEHIPEEVVDRYLARIKEVVRGTLFITVPIERGLPFITKHLARGVMTKEHRDMTRKEFWGHLFGRFRGLRHDGHIGFDDRRLVRQVAEHFKIESLHAIGPAIPLKVMGFQRGIVASNR